MTWLLALTAWICFFVFVFDPRRKVRLLALGASIELLLMSLILR